MLMREHKEISAAYVSENPMTFPSFCKLKRKSDEQKMMTERKVEQREKAGQICTKFRKKRKEVT